MRRWACWLSLPFLLGLVVSGCGGGGGGGVATGVTVTVSPKTVTVSLNGTLTFVASVSGGVVQVATIASNGAVRASGVVTITTTSPHGLSTGQSVTISAVSDKSFNGTFTVATVPSTTTFTYAQTGSSDATSGSGTVSAGAVKWFVNSFENGDATVGKITTTSSTTGSPTVLYTAPDRLPPATTVNIASNGAVRSNNVVTITTTAAHNFVVGQVVTISVTDTSFNGTFSIETVPSSTTFTFSQTTSPATSGGGTVSSTAVQVKAQAVADSTKSGTATVSVVSGINISISRKTATVGTTETFQFFATVTGSTNINVLWSVTGGSSNGTISTNGLYTAPTTVPSPATVTVTATAEADNSKTTTASVTIVTAADPTLTAISPTSAAQGSIFQDVYLTGAPGTQFLSTSAVLLNGAAVLGCAVPSSGVTLISNTLLRARICDSQLSTASTFDVAVKRQSGFTTPPCAPDPTKCQLVVAPVRPALVGASPDNGRQGGGAVSFNVDGGYFGTAASPVVQVEFNGSVRPATVTARQLSNVAIGGEGSGDLSTPGLFSVAVRNNNLAQLMAATNLAVQASPAVTPPSVVTTIPLGSGAQPGAVAVNTATGIAVVANRGTNSITLIDLKTSPPSISGSPITVGTAPTGVAVGNVRDAAGNVRNLALVANNGSNNVSVVNLDAGTVTATLGSADNIGNAPFSVGINPLTGRALVVYQSTNNASLIDLTANPPAVVGTVSASTGANPQVAVEPRLDWAIVTPGGAGSVSIVDLGRRTVNAIAAAPNGASRANNVVTITTTTAHGLVVNDAVLIAGVVDTSFNGTFTVTSVPSSTSFTYEQTGANATSGDGGGVVPARAIYAHPVVAPFALGTDVRGIGINPETEKAVLVDPTSSTITFLSMLDQTVNNTLVLETGAVGAASNPLTDIAVTINPGTGTGAGVASLIDPRTPARLATVNVGTGPKAVAIDPGTNLALVANESSNDLTVILLGAIRSLHITQIIPYFTFTSTSPVSVTLTGAGFDSGSNVRLDGDSTGVTTSFDPTKPRQLTAAIDPSRLGSPRRYALDVLSSGGVHSNVTEFTVIQSVDLASSCSTAPVPRAVAIDPELNIAVVTNTGCNNVALVDLTPGPTFGTITKTVAVGTNPQGVAVIPRLGKAVVTNRGSNNASIVDLVAGSVCGTCTITVGTEPVGVAINQDTATAVVVNSGSNTINTFSADTGGTPLSAAVDARPVAVAIDPVRNVAVIANATQNNLNVVDLSQASLPVTTRVGGFQIPTSVVFDPVPVSGRFVAASSLGNQLFVVNIGTQPAQVQGLKVGINPTTLAYNFQSSTMLTLNTASNTVSVIDFFDADRGVTRAILGSNIAPHCLNTIVVGTGSQQVQQQPPCGADIHPRTNLGVFVDGDNNRLLLVPLPR